MDIETGELVTHFPPDDQVGALLDALLLWFHSRKVEALTIVERAAIFHYEFTGIHPFRDRTGRTARALMTLILRREGFEYKVLVLQQLFDERRVEYIKTLRAADKGNLTPWVIFLVETLHAATLETARLLSRFVE